MASFRDLAGLRAESELSTGPWERDERTRSPPNDQVKRLSHLRSYIPPATKGRRGFPSGPEGWRVLQAMGSRRVGEVAFAVALVLLIAGGLNVAISPRADFASPALGAVRSLSGGSLPSWNPNVACGADLVGVPDVLGSKY